MKVAVVDVAASCGGAASVLTEFYQYIRENRTDIEWYFVLSGPLIEETKGIHVILCPDVKKNWINRLKFDAVDVQKILKKIKPDVVLSLQNILVRSGKIPQVLYVHQSIPFQKLKRFSFLKKEERIYAVYQYLIGAMIKNSIKKADRVFVQTEWMKDAISLYTLRSRIDIISPQMKVPENNSEDPVVFDERHFFYPASNMPYKNHKVIEDAARILAARGISDFSVFFTLSEGEMKTSNIKQIQCIGLQSRETVMQLYSRAVLIFPSYIETFGLPLAEARAVDGLILAADTPFARELLSGYENAYFFDPFNANELAVLMEQVIHKEIKAVPAKKQEDVKINSWELVVNRIKECVS